MDDELHSPRARSAAPLVRLRAQGTSPRGLVKRHFAVSVAGAVTAELGHTGTAFSNGTE